MNIRCRIFNTYKYLLKTFRLFGFPIFLLRVPDDCYFTWWLLFYLMIAILPDDCYFTWWLLFYLMIVILPDDCYFTWWLLFYLMIVILPDDCYSYPMIAISETRIPHYFFLHFAKLRFFLYLIWISLIGYAFHHLCSSMRFAYSIWHTDVLVYSMLRFYVIH